MQIKLNDTVYLRPEDGRLYNEYVVEGETTRSWLLLEKTKHAEWMRSDLARYAKKVPKTLKGWTQGNAYDAAVAKWALNNGYAISTVLQGQDAKVLLQVAKLIDYKILPEVTQ